MKVTIITATFNSAATIADTLRSVQEQSYKDIEHIIIDGGSKDETLSIVCNLGGHVAKVVSEPDKGLYDAMNKGMRLATGDVIAYLNSDDWYASPSTVALAVNAFDERTDMVYGDLEFVQANPPHRVMRVWSDRQCRKNSFAWGWQPAHPATFMRTSLLRKVEGFDLRFKIAADYAMFSRCFTGAKASAKHVPAVFTNMRLGGVSTSGVRSVLAGNRECWVALKESGLALPWATLAMKLARKVIQLRSR